MPVGRIGSLGGGAATRDRHVRRGGELVGTRAPVSARASRPSDKHGTSDKTSRSPPSPPVMAEEKLAVSRELTEGIALILTDSAKQNGGGSTSTE